MRKIIGRMYWSGIQAEFKECVGFTFFKGLTNLHFSMWNIYWDFSTQKWEKKVDGGVRHKFTIRKNW